MQDIDAVFALYANSGAFKNPDLIDGNKIYRVRANPYTLYAERFFGNERKTKLDRLAYLRMKWGKLHETEYTSSIDPELHKQHFQSGDEGFYQFLRACFDGVPYIYNPPIIYPPELLSGRPDLLIRCDDHPSIFGDYHYTVKEIKLATNLRSHHVLQGALYNKIIGLIQGYTAPSFQMVNYTNRIREYEMADCENELNAAIHSIREILNGSYVPPPIYGSCNGTEWEDVCNEQAGKTRDLSLVNGISQSTRAKLLGINIGTVDDLATKNVDDLLSIEGMDEHRAWVFLQHSRAYARNEPVFLDKINTDVFRHTNLVFLDFEATDATHPDIDRFDFLIGFYYRDDGELKYRSFIAGAPHEEERMFHRFIAFLQQLEDPCIVHWSNYERIAFRRLFRKYPIPNFTFAEIDPMFVDLHAYFKQRVVFPIPSYSIKKLAPCACGFKWQQEDVDAAESVVLFYEYMKTQEESLLEKIVQYNMDDCEAMVRLHEWLMDQAGQG